MGTLSLSGSASCLGFYYEEALKNMTFPLGEERGAAAHSNTKRLLPNSYCPCSTCTLLCACAAATFPVTPCSSCTGHMFLQISLWESLQVSVRVFWHPVLGWIPIHEPQSISQSAGSTDSSAVTDVMYHICNPWLWVAERKTLGAAMHNYGF